ncbi:non-heme iron oxygenase ferredoxin subunit [Aeoliella mucimassa]|uniref:Naphthalene 1,2-dioxygenase/salicylate 5-hydroxylase system, ferredoxin component n=1 Tax=Aeoliella mucimassa TaxID=2527972 RepID=A0A518AP45_9BACT|nr:non-heme iron oxygenase ferredoxin subunit [Aeoliella mucimassa]QDU56498.1 Naphthalene 1,2-dioxygenase/salicylate 5-hydroxylase system, ferredoxin component [Aeoliella mucimassa]
MSDFVSVASVDSFADPDRQLVEVDDQLVVLVHAGGNFFALDDVCTHDGGPLSDGAIDPEGCTIACPRHGAKFDLATGAAKTMPATKATKAHEVKVEGGQVYVRLAD